MCSTVVKLAVLVFHLPCEVHIDEITMQYLTSSVCPGLLTFLIISFIQEGKLEASCDSVITQFPHGYVCVGNVVGLMPTRQEYYPLLNFILRQVLQSCLGSP